MKRIGNLKNRIVDFDNICLGAYKAFKGKRNKAEVKYFLDHLDENVMDIYNQLNNNCFEFGIYNTFTIFEPKERLICAASLRERIVHHTLMNVCHDYFDNQLIYDTYAARKGKGIHAAVERLKVKMNDYDYFVKLDVRRYFDSVLHDKLKQILNDIFKDRWLLDIFASIIDSYCISAGKGLPIGNLTSQYFANIYLSGLDHFMKEVKRVPVYIRYMDDVVMLGNSRVQLKVFANSLMEYCNSQLGLSIKPPIIGKSINGVVFLGYRISKYQVRLSSKSARRFKYKYNILEDLLSGKQISENEYSMRMHSLLSFINKAETKKFRNSIINRVNVL